jgi:hypothetical protein
VDSRLLFLGYLFQLISGLWYVVSVFRRRTLPSLFGVSLYALAMGLVAYSSWRLGGVTFWMAAIGSFANLLALGIAVFRRQAFQPTPFEGFLLLLVFASLVGKALFSSDALLFFINLFVDAIGSLVIALKLWKQPATEEPWPWLVCTLGYAFSAFGVSNWSEWASSALPLMNVLLCALIFSLSLRTNSSQIALPRL